MNEDKTGLVIDNRFSPEEDVFNTVEWETRDAVISGDKDNIIFEQKDIEAPKEWSQLATQIVASKYFAGKLGTDARETSVRDMISRVTNTITKRGLEKGYFNTITDSKIFNAELSYIILHQMATFNSPVWFNIGVEDRTQQASACFILNVEDDMESILEWYKEEGRIFKGGSGSGVNLSKIRASSESLSGGGHASGPVSFMRGADSIAGGIKSGGTCLAPWTKVYTENGPVEVKDLIDGKFIVLSWDPPTNQYKAKKATAWKAGEKEVVRVHTDKGYFDLSHDHPLKLSTGEFVKASELTKDTSLFKCSIYNNNGYVHVAKGNTKYKSKELFHRMIARDIIKDHSESIHHIDDNRLNNCPSNLQGMSQSEHATLHAKELVQEGKHVFQNKKFPKKGNKNGMHSSSEFWNDTEKVISYKEKQAELLSSERASDMQSSAIKHRMINMGFKIINNGYTIDTFNDYIIGRKSIARLGYSKSHILKSIENNFESYDNFKSEIYASNHKVISIEVLGNYEVYDVEVQCPTIDDKSPQTGHNFVIWSGDNNSHFGSGIVATNTRRAAKMVILDVDHPDIEEFIDCKSIEEEKAYALGREGYDMGLNGEAWRSIQFQNANNSVRVNKKFIDAVKNEVNWNLVSRDGTTTTSVSAKDLIHKMAQAAWSCGDPGIQYDDNINDWHTCPNTGRINGSNPCSEYMHLDNSACNLASINLMKFYNNERFQCDDFNHTVDIMILAQDILVGTSEYPTKKIEETTKAYRQLGLGYANLGALLMSMGLPYDSVEGRHVAASITSLMTGRAYLQSAFIAKIMGPFDGYTLNKQPMLKIIKKHKEENENIDSLDADASNIMYDATDAWNDAYVYGKQVGFRNSQVTVLAPTGTIAFMMDCDTTGIEPDLSLIKYKKLVGGGTVEIVNQSVEQALNNLNYPPTDIVQIMSEIKATGSIESASPWLDEENLAIFDCSLKPAKGHRFIHHMGHVNMMAAVQPFLSGAISKTINMPEDSTVKDIEEVYITGQELGLKALAIYRDGSKKVQPLSTSKEEGPEVVEKIIKVPVRRRLPDTRKAVTHKFEIAGHEGYLTIGVYEEGSPGEIFIHMSKEGSTISGLMDAFATSVSVALQYGVPLDHLIKKFSHMRFEPAGFTGNSAVPIAKSPIDYIFRWIEQEFNKEEEPQISESFDDSPSCSDCGSIMKRSGSCYTCTECGSTSGCS